jgi:hypothetical protein
MYEYARSHYKFFSENIKKDLENQNKTFEIDLNNPISYYL